MKTIKIFLASSSELESDRREFEIFINRQNKEYIKQDLFLELLLWEDFIDAMSATRLQDEYNNAVKSCDIFVSLFHTKVGKYTEEEFLKALETFKNNGKPLIYTYFNQTKVEITPQIISLLNFQQKLSDMGHFYTKYDNIDDLKFRFSEQLGKVLPRLTGIETNNIQDNNNNNQDHKQHHATKVIQNFYGTVDNATGNVGRDLNIGGKTTSGDRNINMGSGNYNENIHGDYYEQSGNFGIGHMSGGTIQGNAKVGGVINEGAAENTEDVAAEIRNILTKLSNTLPTSTNKEKNQIVTQAADQIESNSALKAKVTNAMTTQDTEAFKDAINHPLANKLIVFIEE